MIICYIQNHGLVSLLVVEKKMEFQYIRTMKIKKMKMTEKSLTPKENTWKMCFQKLKVKEGQSTSEKMSFLISWSQICLLSIQFMTK